MAAPALDLPKVELHIVEMTNQVRRAQNLATLQINGMLAKAARAYAERLARSGQFSHTADGRNPGKRAESAGYKPCTIAENIAMDRSSQGFDSGQLAKEFRTKGPKSSNGRSGAGAARGLANFGESAEEKIARIADGYNPAPRGLDKAFTDLRALDKLIADLGTRKPPSFEKLIGEAKDARAAVLSGISAPLDEIQQRLVPLPDGIAKAQTAIKELDGVIWPPKTD